MNLLPKEKSIIVEVDPKSGIFQNWRVLYVTEDVDLDLVNHTNSVCCYKIMARGALPVLAKQSTLTIK
ncbi:hypothetical protein Brsp01_13250 [Brucella sp. NBRC 12950]|nr:hypothetical protein Brsp01_13250 [Brucella sp. NBRC 12950]